MNKYNIVSNNAYSLSVNIHLFAPCVCIFPEVFVFCC